MNRPELGHKYSCVGCGARFYDLNRSPAVCPKCEVHQPTEKPRALRATGGGGGFGRRAGWHPLPRAAQEEPEPAVVAEDEDAETEDREDAEDDADDADSGVDELPNIEESAV